MKKRIALALAMAICLSLLCTVALADKVTVNFFHRWPNEPKNSYINSLIDEFEAANPDIDIVSDCVLNDSYKEKIRVLVSTDALPDVFFSWSGVFGENLTRSGRVLALDDVMARQRVVQPDRRRSVGSVQLQRQAVRRAVVHGRQGVLLQRGRVQRAGHRNPDHAERAVCGLRKAEGKRL